MTTEKSKAVCTHVQRKTGIKEGGSELKIFFLLHKKKCIRMNIQKITKKLRSKRQCNWRGKFLCSFFETQICNVSSSLTMVKDHFPRREIILQNRRVICIIPPLDQRKESYRRCANSSGFNVVEAFSRRKKCVYVGKPLSRIKKILLQEKLEISIGVQ